MRKLKYLITLLTLCLVAPTVVQAKRDKSAAEKKEKRKKRKKGKKKRYPFKVNVRPLVLPAGMNEVSAAFSLTSIPTGDDSTNLSMLGVGFKRGIIKHLELGGTTGLQISPDADWNSQFVLGAGYKIAGKRKGLSLAAQVNIPLNFAEGQDVLSGVNLGLATRYRINRKIALHTGENLVNLAFGEETTTRINIPVGVAFQATRQLNLRADTQLFSFGSGESTSIADALPLQFRGLYAIKRMMDVGGAFNTDLTNDTGFTIMGLFNLRM